MAAAFMATVLSRLVPRRKPRTLPPARRAYGSESLRLGERHSGFNVYCGNAIWPHNEEGLASGSESLRLGERT